MRIIIADDSAIIREGLAGMLGRRGHDIVATATNANELINRIEQAMAAEADQAQAPDSAQALALDATGSQHATDHDAVGQSGVDLIVTDVRMPPNMRDDGLIAAIEIRKRWPKLPIIILSQYVSTPYAVQLFNNEQNTKTGGLGYLLKDRVAHIADFSRAIEVVSHGGVVVDPEVTTAMIHSSHSGLSSLTRREAEVLDLMAQGQSNTQISQTLYLTMAAVAKHVASIFLKLGLDPHEDNRRVRAILMYLSQHQSRW